MPLRLTPLEHVLARLNLLPVPLFDIPLAPGIAKILVTACEMGIFDALSEQALSLEELAERLHCDPQGLLLLLQLLVSAGYLRHRRGHYANTRMAQRWLTSASPDSVAPYIIHSPDIVAIWDHLPCARRASSRIEFPAIPICRIRAVGRRSSCLAFRFSPRRRWSPMRPAHWAWQT